MDILLYLLDRVRYNIYKKLKKLNNKKDKYNENTKLED